MKHLLVPICNRTNYTKLKTVLREFTAIKPVIAMSSSILLSKYGDPHTDIEKDVYEIVSRIDCSFMNDSTSNMAKTCGLSMIEHASLFNHIKPDGVLIVGDRFDMLSPLISAKMMNIPIFHIQGGEHSGSIDDTIRDMMSLCASYHYTSTLQSSERVMEIAHIKNVIYSGCPAVEYISQINIGEFLDVSSLTKKFKHNIDIKPYEEYYLVILHPDTTHKDEVNMGNLLHILTSTEKKIIVFYPNIDAHNNNIVDAIREMRNQLIILRHVPVDDFAKLMAHAKAVIGNSSSIIRETATFGVPSINIGDRQKNRERNQNTIDIPSSLDGLLESLSVTNRCSNNNIYFKHGAGKTIANHIEKILCKDTNEDS